MNNKLCFFLCVLLSILFSFCSPYIHLPLLSPEEKLHNEIRYLIDDPEVANAQIGIYIESLKDRKVLFRQNEHKLFVPGSNQKLFTTVVALEKLGEEFQFKTNFYSTGKLLDSVLTGDLLIYGMGDPTISGRFRENDALAYFKDWADSLKANGICKIDGNIIACDGYFSDKKLGLAWEWDDLPFYYAAAIDALSYNENYVDVFIEADSTISDSVFVAVNPCTDYMTIENTAFTIDKDSASTLNVWRNQGHNIIEIKGGLPGSQTKRELVTVENPALWFAKMFESVLKSKNIPISGECIVDAHPFEDIQKYDTNFLFSHSSPTLAEIVKVINKESNNLFAEQIFKTLAAQFKKQGTAAEAALVLSEWLSTIGITENQAVIKDGSGLSRRNLISPFAIATLLRYMYNSNNFKIFFDSLPIAGVDGTLTNRMINTAAQNIARAKTGHVSNVWCLSGYTTDRTGNDYLFVIMINHFSIESPYIKNLQDKICVLLTNYYPSN